MFSMSKLSIEQGKFGKLISILTLSFYSKCALLMIKSLLILGSKCSKSVMAVKKKNAAIADIEIHAPEAVPSLRSLGTAL